MDKLISLRWQDHARFRFIKGEIDNHDINILMNIHRRDTIIPAAVDKYREIIWPIECNSLAAKINLFKSSPEQQECTKRSTHQLRSIAEISLSLLKYYKPCLNKYSKDFIIKHASRYPIFLFDSYWLFAAGHICCLSSTLAIINMCYQEWLGIILIDKNLVLFPEMVKILQEKYNNLIFIDVTNDTIHFSDIHDLFPLGQENINFIKKMLSNHQLTCSFDGNFFNPCFLLSTLKPLKVDNNFQTNTDNNTMDLKEEFSSFHARFSKPESMEIVVKLLGHEKSFFSRYRKFVAYHERNPYFRWGSIRDSLPLNERLQLVSKFKREGVGIIVIGIVPRELQAVSDNILYLCNMPPMINSLQLHIFNAAIAVIGSVSGATNLSHLTNTPTIIIDSPYPFYSLPPFNFRSHMLLKRVFKNGIVQSPIKYYEFEDMAEYFLSDNYNPLMESGYTLKCCDDDSIYNTFLLLNSSLSSKILNTDRRTSLLENHRNISSDQLQLLRQKVNHLRSKYNTQHSQALVDEFTLSPYNWH